MKYLMETHLSDDKSLFSSFEVPSNTEARRRAHLRLSQPDVKYVVLWIETGCSWRWLASFSIEDGALE